LIDPKSKTKWESEADSDSGQALFNWSITDLMKKEKKNGGVT